MPFNGIMSSDAAFYVGTSDVMFVDYLYYTIYRCLLSSVEFLYSQPHLLTINMGPVKSCD